MKLRKASYLVHRWLGLIISLQLLAWSLGGLMFSVLELSYVRGEDNTPAAQPALIEPSSVQVTPSEAIERADVDSVSFIELRVQGGGPAYVLRDGERRALAWVDASSGTVTLRISPDDAGAMARAGFSPDSPVRAVELLESSIPGEARGREPPLYVVTLDHESNPRLYLDVVSGEIVARRNDAWRVFDFFWMLHIMDYDDREDFNHWLLTLASALAVLTSASGLALWAWRASGRLRRRVRDRRHIPA